MTFCEELCTFLNFVTEGHLKLYQFKAKGVTYASKSFVYLFNPKLPNRSTIFRSVRLPG
jgi:hypothetical protein